LWVLFGRLGLYGFALVRFLILLVFTSVTLAAGVVIGKQSEKIPFAVRTPKKVFEWDAGETVLRNETHSPLL